MAAMVASSLKCTSRSMHTLLAVAVLVLCAHSVAGFYLPGVAPNDYVIGDQMRVKVLHPLLPESATPPAVRSRS